MKKILIVAGAIVALASCKETDPIIKPAPAMVDTTYVISTLPAADPHNVLIEDFTGAACSNCPNAAAVITSLEGNNPGRINAMGMFVLDFPQAIPPTGAKYDFRTDAATEIEDQIYGNVFAEPIGGIDRQALGSAVLGSVYQVQYQNWNTDVATRLDVSDSINLSVSSVYDPNTHTDSIRVITTYLYPTSTAHALSIAIVEDSFVDMQEQPNTTFDTAYQFNHVLREMATSVPFGDAILPLMATKEAGRVDDRVYIHKVSTQFNPAHCRIIAFVTDAGNKSTNVCQSVQTKMVP